MLLYLISVAGQTLIVVVNDNIGYDIEVNPLKGVAKGEQTKQSQDKPSTEIQFGADVIV
jgi:hypothetical protein